MRILKAHMDASRDRASEELNNFGWHSLTDIGSLQIDGVGSADHYIGRAWSPDGSYRALGSPGGIYVLLGIEGRATVTYDGASYDVPRDHLFFLDAEADIHVHLTAATARYLWRLRPDAFSHPLVRATIGEPLPVSGDTWKIAGALTNSALDAPARLGDSVHLARAAENLLTAVAVDATARVAPSRRADHVYSEAMQQIELSFRHPDCGIATIAAGVLVSERTLGRAFAAMGTTVRAQIENRRVEELLRIDRTGEFDSSFAVRTEMAGFRNVRQARAALVRAGARIREHG